MHDVRTQDPCRSCGCKLVTTGTWRAADSDQRAIWNAAGLREHKGRGLCSRCYYRHRQDGTLADFERTTMPEDMVVAEWHRLDDGDGSRAQRVQRLAPRLGMKPDALERALDRAGIRSEREVPNGQGFTRQRGLVDCRGCAACTTHEFEVAHAERHVTRTARRLAGTREDCRLHGQLQQELADAKAHLAWEQAARDAHHDSEHQDVEVAA